jgi:dCMP deaminase
LNDEYFMKKARAAAHGSTDRSRKVGAVFVSMCGRYTIEAANHFPMGVEDREERHERPEKYFWTEHAERNAIYTAARNGVSTFLGTMYLPWFPCMDCARALIQSGIAHLVAVKPDLSDPKWGEDFKRVEQLLAEGGVKLRFAEE